MMPKGFALIEVMLTIAAIAILAGVVVLAVNPSRQMAEARNGARRADVATIWNAVQQYMLNNPGTYPTAIPTGFLESCLEDPRSSEFTICKTGSCGVYLPELLENTAYLVDIPTDPSIEDEEYSGYNIILDEEHNNRVTVCAPLAENEEEIYLPR